MEQFKGSSDFNRTKTESNEREQKDITHMNVNVKVKKANKAKGVFKLLFSKDIFSAIKDAFIDVMVPNFKDNMARTGKNVIDQMFYDVPSKGGSYNSINYSNSYYSPSYGTGAIKTINNVPSRPARRSSIYDVNNIIFHDLSGYTDPKTGEHIFGVLEVIAQLQDICRRYGSVSVFDFYDIIQQPGNNFMDDKYGWYNLEGLNYVRRGDGYVINFPRVEVLDKN